MGATCRVEIINSIINKNKNIKLIVIVCLNFVPKILWFEHVTSKKMIGKLRYITFLQVCYVSIPVSLFNSEWPHFKGSVITCNLRLILISQDLESHQDRDSLVHCCTRQRGLEVPGNHAQLLWQTLLCVRFPTRLPSQHALQWWEPCELPPLARGRRLQQSFSKFTCSLSYFFSFKCFNFN